MRPVLFLVMALLGSTLAASANPRQPSTPPRLPLTPAQAAQVSAYTPLPRYPIAARVSHVTGAGMFRLLVSFDTGLVKSVEIEQSTGQAILATAATNMLKRWRFKPDLLRA